MQQRLLRWVEEGLTPVEGGAQGALALRAGAPTIGEQAQGVVQAVGQLRDRQDGDAGGGEFEGQGDAIETADDFDDGAGVVGREGEGGLALAYPLQQEADGGRVGDVGEGAARRWTGEGRRDAQGSDAPDSLALHT